MYALLLQKLREPVGGTLGVTLQPVVEVDEVYPEANRVAVHPLEVVQKRPREVLLHVRPVAAVDHKSDAVASRCTNTNY